MAIVIKNRTNPDVEYVHNNILNDPSCYTTNKLRAQLEDPETIVTNMQGEMAWITLGLLEKKFVECDSSLTNNRSLFESVDEELSTQVVLAPPVLMAVVAGFYDLVEPLLQYGHTTMSIFDNNIIGEQTGRIIACSSTYSVALGEYILDDPYMPDELRLCLLDHMKQELQRSEKDTDVEINLGINVMKCVSSLRELHEQLMRRGIIPKSEYHSCEQLMNSLRLIINERPGFLQAITTQWSSMLARRWDSTFSNKLVCLLLESFELTNIQKKQLLDMYHCFQRHDEDDNFENIIEELEKPDLSFYKDIVKYYQEDPDLERYFAEILLYLCVEWEDYCIEFNTTFSETKGELDECFVRFAKRCLPKDYGLDSFFSIELGDKNICCLFNHMAAAIKAYRKVVNSRIQMNEQVSFETWYTARSSCMFDWIISPKAEYQWLKSIDEFSFDDKAPLNGWQKVLLSQNSEDLFEWTLSRGLLRGKHIEEAMNYCMYRKDKHNRIPCIMAYAEE